MAQERKKGKKMLGKEELHGKGHRVCELLNTIDSDSNNNHLPAHILSGTGLSLRITCFIQSSQEAGGMILSRTYRGLGTWPRSFS